MNSPPEENETGPTCEFEDSLCMLREIPFFSGYPLESLKVFAYLCICESYKSGDYLFRQEEDDGNAFYIMSGQATLIRRIGADEQDIRTLGAGEFVGGISLLGKMPRLFDLKAITDMSCMVLAREKHRRTMEQFPDLIPIIFRAVIGGVRGWEERFLLNRSEDCEACRNNIGVSLV